VTEPGYVLVVDDDPDMVEIVTKVLNHAGYPTRGADNGLQALEAASKEKPALVLLDMLMPVMNGWDCAYELRSRYGRTLPIIVVSAAEHAETWRAEVGADAVLEKPFEISDLLQLVSSYVGPAAA
jgi:two-component system, chemotaxis family, chemotaxis protein CheY